MGQVETLLPKRKSRSKVAIYREGLCLLGFALLASITETSLCAPNPLQVFRVLVSPIFLAVVLLLILVFFAGLWLGRRNFDLTPEQHARVAAGE